MAKNNLKGKDVVSIKQFNKNDISLIFKTADKIKKSLLKKKILTPLKGKIITLLFFEPSSRTFSSFSTAAKRLGAQTLEYQNPMQTSSSVKGETLEDTIRVFTNYSDAIIMRHPQNGSVNIAADSTSIPVLNAGDGSGEHPTQALLDLYTIHKKFGKTSGLTGLIAGDLLYGRTVHSLLKVFSYYPKNIIYLLAPKRLRLPEEIFSDVSKKIKLIIIDSEKDIPENCNFWYWTRVQKERFSDLHEYDRIKTSFIITPELLEKKGNKRMVIMHPLPRVGEIDPQIDSDPRALYLSEQIKNGLYIRMALLKLIMGP